MYMYIHMRVLTCTYVCEKPDIKINQSQCSLIAFMLIFNGEHTFVYYQYIHKCITNKAIRDGKYLARHMPVLGNIHPIQIENFDIFS